VVLAGVVHKGVIGLSHSLSGQAVDVNNLARHLFWMFWLSNGIEMKIAGSALQRHGSRHGTSQELK
jgi:hypothetical protein